MGPPTYRGDDGQAGDREERRAGDATEERPLNSAAKVDARWVARGADNTQAGTALEAALRKAGAPAADARIYLACEAAAYAQHPPAAD